MIDILNVIKIMTDYMVNLHIIINKVKKKNNNNLLEINEKLNNEFESYEIECYNINNKFKLVKYSDLLNFIPKNENKFKITFVNDLNLNTVNYLKNKVENFKELLKIKEEYSYFYLNYITYGKNIKLKKIENGDVIKCLFYNYIKSNEILNYDKILEIVSSDYTYYLDFINKNINLVNYNIDKDILYNYYNNYLRKEDYIYDKITSIDTKIHNILLEINDLESYKDINSTNIIQIIDDLKNEKRIISSNQKFKVFLDELKKIENIIEISNTDINLLNIKIKNKTYLIDKLLKKYDIKNINKKKKIIRIQNLYDMKLKDRYIKKIENLGKNDKNILIEYKKLIIGIKNEIRKLNIKIKKNKKELININNKILKINETEIPKLLKDKYQEMMKKLENNKKEIEMENKLNYMKLDLNFKTKKKYIKEYNNYEREIYEKNNEIDNEIKKYRYIIKNIENDINERKIDMTLNLNEEEINSLNVENNKKRSYEIEKIKINKGVNIELEKKKIIELNLNRNFNFIFGIYNKIDKLLKLFEELKNNFNLKNEYLDKILNKDNLNEKIENEYKKKYIDFLIIDKIIISNNENMNKFIENYFNFLKDFIMNMYNLNNYYNLTYLLNNEYNIFNYDEYNKNMLKEKNKCKDFFNKLNEELINRKNELSYNFCKKNKTNLSKCKKFIKINKLLYKYEDEYKNNNNRIKIINKYINKYSK